MNKELRIKTMKNVNLRKKNEECKSKEKTR